MSPVKTETTPSRISSTKKDVNQQHKRPYRKHLIQNSGFINSLGLKFLAAK